MYKVKNVYINKLISFLYNLKQNVSKYISMYVDCVNYLSLTNYHIQILITHIMNYLIFQLIHNYKKYIYIYIYILFCYTFI